LLLEGGKFTIGALAVRADATPGEVGGVFLVPVFDHSLQITWPNVSDMLSPLCSPKKISQPRVTCCANSCLSSPDSRRSCAVQ
jgi:hypothetical protein